MKLSEKFTLLPQLNTLPQWMGRLSVLKQGVALSDLGPTCTPLQSTFLWVATSPDVANLPHFPAAAPRFDFTSCHRWGCRTSRCICHDTGGSETLHPRRSPNPCLDKSINNPFGKVHCQPSLDPADGSGQRWQTIQRWRRYAIDAHQQRKTDESAKWDVRRVDVVRRAVLAIRLLIKSALQLI